jgi:hypothetical protein
MDARGWATPDIIMEEVTVPVVARSTSLLYLPLLLRR